MPTLSVPRLPLLPDPLRRIRIPRRLDEITTVSQGEAGADALSLFGPDTDKAFGHLGFTNILGWATPSAHWPHGRARRRHPRATTVPLSQLVAGSVTAGSMWCAASDSW